MTEQQWIDKLISKIDPKELRILQDEQIDSPIYTIQLAKKLGIIVSLPEMKEVKKKEWIYKDPLKHTYNIVLNPIFPDVMKKFTLAHEIAHFFLYKKYINQFESLYRNCSKEFKNFNIIEWEANLIASEIIMPTKLVHPLVKDKEYKNLRISEQIVKLTHEITEKFKVSKETTDRRACRTLRALGYIKYQHIHLGIV